MRELLDAVAAAEARLDATVAAMTDDEAGRPSRLPGWTRAEVVTHLARNADSNAAMVAATLRGESRAQYPGGREQRSAEIAAGRGRSAAELLTDLREAATGWAFVMAAVLDDQWSLMVAAGVGPRPVSQRVHSRLLEVEVHHADLGLAYTFRDWPEEFAAEQLARTVRSLPERRTDAAVPGRWRVGSSVVAVGESVSVAEGGDADGAVDGPPGALLAWLLGRESAGSAGLSVSGDPRVAVLPAAFPYP
ncbi:MAG TPA: maleylpyruvate isomerase family mycothiol-dependent enzyme [Frankiaceae bacterium]|nr:maleylpyruvate isomerase family mycothiol-dependent enzyme [Frankiaceae bacterium]